LHNSRAFDRRLAAFDLTVAPIIAYRLFPVQCSIPKKSLIAIPCALRLNHPGMGISDEYLIVSASLKAISRSRMMAEYVATCFREHSILPGLVDLRDSVLPLCDGESAYGHPQVDILSRKIAAARVLLVATPIYNFDASAALKNLVELTGDSWEDKIVGFICAAGGLMSYMSIMALANSLMLDFRCVIIPRFVYATGRDFADQELVSSEVKERIRDLVSLSIKIIYR
jgi:NAD(P)H-dependent FMN reductase